MNTQTPPDTRRELESLLRSRIPLVVIETRDEPYALDLLASLAPRLAQVDPVHTPIFKWAVTDGLCRLDIDLGVAQRHNSEPAEVLKSIRATAKAGVYILLDFHPYISDPVHTRLIKDICLSYERVPRTLVFISHAITLPAELEHFAAHFNLTFPNREERRNIVEGAASEWARLHNTKVRTDRKALELLLDNLAGLSIADTKRLARRAIFNDGAISEADIASLMQAKYQLLNRSGVLSFEYDVAKMDEVGGMQHLKAWLQQRIPAFTGTAPLDPPKGVLLLGVQGCGKSLCARAAANLFGVPLLRFDFGALYNKYHGESERNLRDTLSTALQMAPCVLWIDEIEKGLASSNEDGGTSRRILGSFLTWLAEPRTGVFIVATANDISALSPELLRKGRFDEIFFVDLPDTSVRTDILRLHTEKRGCTFTTEALQALAQAADGFSGAELEQAVVAAVYSAHAKAEPLTAKHVLAEIHATRPLSVVMAEKITALRAWAAERTVAAN